MKRTDLDVGPGALLEYEDWLKRARHGDVLVYWVGDLQNDRQETFDDHDPSQEVRRKQIGALGFLADRIKSDARRKDVALTQKRLGEGRYEYRATRTRMVSDHEPRTVRTRHGVAVLA